MRKQSHDYKKKLKIIPSLETGTYIAPKTLSKESNQLIAIAYAHAVCEIAV